MSARERRRKRRKLAAGAGLGIGAALGASATAQAADYTVTNLNDSGPGSLRQALLDANLNPGGDRVLFQSTLSGQITLGSQLPNVTDAVAILGPGAAKLTISGNHNSRILYVKPTAHGAPVTISGLTLTAANSVGGGAAIYAKYTELTVENTVISNSTTTMGNGGGIYASASPLTVRSSTFVGNSTSDTNGGGAIVAVSTKAHTLTIENSTITGNRAGFGGGVRLRDPLQVMQMHIHSSTISGNTATYATAGGGGIYMYGAGASADTLTNTIVANNTAPIGPDIRSSTPVGASFSLIGNPSGASITGGPNIFGQDPKLGPLADNGGPTPTEALLPGSPAFDKGSSAGLTTDQRGASRPFDLKGIGSAAGGDSADIGAYERNLCGKVVVNRVGTQGNDVLTGAAGADGILGLGGNDTLTGLAGNDALCGGPGRDKLKGGSGNDALFGQAGKDKLFGQAGNDKLVGGKGNDLLAGGKGKDKLKGGPGKDKEKQ